MRNLGNIVMKGNSANGENQLSIGHMTQVEQRNKEIKEIKKCRVRDDATSLM